MRPRLSFIRGPRHLLEADFSSPRISTSVRYFSLNPATWGRRDIGRSSNPHLEDELPDIFSSQPSEVDDYVRPDKSFFESLEDKWDWLLGFFQPIDKQMEILRGLHTDGFLGIDFYGWGGVLLFYGACLRLLTLFPSLYSHRNSLRMGAIGTQLSEISSLQNRAKSDRTLSTAEKRVIKNGYNRMKHALYTREGCNQWKSFGGAITAPVTATAFLAIRRLSLYETDLNGASFLWVSDLTRADPTFALPVICATIFLCNFELNQRMQRGGRSSGNLYIRWGTRCAASVGVYIFSSQPAALFTYWIGLSCVGILQPVLLRWQPFRTFFRFPAPPQAARGGIVGARSGASSNAEGSPSAGLSHSVFDSIDNYPDAVEFGRKKP